MSFDGPSYGVYASPRSCFNELQYTNTTTWMVLDYISDALYYLDTFVRARTGWSKDFYLNHDKVHAYRKLISDHSSLAIIIIIIIIK